MTRDPRERHRAALRPWIARARAHRGWDLRDLGVRRSGARPPWSYRGTVAAHAASAARVLDLGTGGGERLAAMRSALPRAVIATESWLPNVPVAARRLRPLGVEVLHADSEALPLAGGAIDLALSRHEAIDPAEIARVLRPGGRLVTQQLGRHHWRELGRYFPRRVDHGDHRTRYGDALRAAGLVVASVEHEGCEAYPSTGALAAMLTLAPWDLPGFDIESDDDLDALLALARDCAGPDGIVLTDCRYLLVARRPRG